MRRFCFTTIAISVLSVCMFNDCYGQENSIDPSYILNQYRENLKHIVPMSFDFQKELNDPINHFVEKSWGHLRYDGINLQRTQRNAAIGEIAKNQERVLELLICPNSMYMKILSGNDSGNETDFVVTSFLEIPSDFNVAQNLGELSMIFGWVYLDQSPYFLPDILSFLKPDSVMVEKESNGEYVLSGKNNDIEIISRFNPNAGNMLSFFSYKRLTVQPQLNDTYQYKVKSFVKQHHYFFPDECCIDITRTGGDFTLAGKKLISPKTQSKSEIKFKNIERESKLITKDDIISKIPNGTKVFMQDVPQIEHIWFDGKIEPKTDELMLRIARGGHRFIPGVWEPRFWFIAAGAVLIFLGLFFKIKMIIQDWKEK